jgi:DNA primase
VHAGRKAAVRGSTTVSWQDVRSVDLESFVKTSGGKGLHIAAALMSAPAWDDVKASPKHRRCQREQSRPLRRHRDQIKAQGQDPHRLFAQWTRLDRRRAVFDARAAWCCHIHAAGLGELSLAIGPAYFTVTNALRKKLKRAANALLLTLLPEDDRHGFGAPDKTTGNKNDYGAVFGPMRMR